MFRPTLPPKKGYVEFRVNGRSYYRNAKTGVLEIVEKAEGTAEEQLRNVIERI